MGFFSKTLKIVTPLAVVASVSAGIMTVRDVKYRGTDEQKVMPANPTAGDIFWAFGRNFGKSIAWGFRQTGEFIKGAYDGLWEDSPPAPSRYEPNKDRSAPRKSSLMPRATDPVATLPEASPRPVASLPGVPGLVHSFRLESAPVPSAMPLLPTLAENILKNNAQTKNVQPLEIT